MSLAPDFGVGVSIKDLKALNHSILVPWRGAITHIMENLGSHSVILVLSQVKQSVPEVRLVELHFAWTHLLRCL